MKIAPIGTTGHVGHHFLNEAPQCGYAVAVPIRDPNKLVARDGLCVVQADASDPIQVASAVTGHEMVTSIFSGGWSSIDLRTRHVASSQIILDSVKRSGVPCLLVLGDVGSLEIIPGQRLVGSPEFLEQWKQSALGAVDALDQLHGGQRLDWVFLNPVTPLKPGQRNGKFHPGGGQVLFDARGESRIPLEDPVVAMLDEAEQSRHHRQHFTVAY